jgi:hypothetical protein
MQRRLSAAVGSLRRGLASARSLHASLRSEAAALESFVPVIVEDARSGMQQALQQQACSAAQKTSPTLVPANLAVDHSDDCCMLPAAAQLIRTVSWSKSRPESQTVVCVPGRC